MFTVGKSMLDAKDVNGGKEGIHMCGVCEEGKRSSATVYCPACCDFLCDLHARPHAKSGGTKSHKTLTIEEYQKQAATGSKFVFLY